jgi:hypothetical protein
LSTDCLRRDEGDKENEEDEGEIIFLSDPKEQVT